MVGCDFDTTQATLLWATPCFWKVLKMFMKSQSQALGCMLFIELSGFLYSLKLENHVLWSLFLTLWVRLWRHGKESSLALADYIHLVHPPPVGQMFWCGVLLSLASSVLSFLEANTVLRGCTPWLLPVTQACVSPSHLESELEHVSVCTPWGPFRQDIHSQAGVVFRVVKTADRGRDNPSVSLAATA